MAELLVVESPKQTQFIGDLSDKQAVYLGAAIMRFGHGLAVHNGPVWALWGDAADQKFVERVDDTKGRLPNQPFAMTDSFEACADLVDFDRVHPNLHELFATPEKLARRIGALAFLRFPAKAEAIKTHAVPERLISQSVRGPTLQNYDPVGKANLMNLLNVAREVGVRWPAVTSLNAPKQPEIIDLEAAIEYCHQEGFAALKDSLPHHSGVGSFAIINADERGLELVREGNISNQLLDDLMDGYDLTPADTLIKRKAIYQPFVGDEAPALHHLKAEELRTALLQHFGWQQ